MIRLTALLVSLCLTLSTAFADEPIKQPTKSIYGWVEGVTLDADGTPILVKAKLDTGAKSSSLHAENVRSFQCDCDDGEFVLFDIVDRKGKLHTLQRKVKRYVKIKRHNGDHDRRPTVLMTVCIGATSKEVEVNLVDRNNFLYPLLLGRTALVEHAIVDPSNTFLNTASCAGSTAG